MVVSVSGGEPVQAADVPFKASHGLPITPG